MCRLSSILFLVAVVLPGTLSQSAPTVTVSSTSYAANSGTSITLQCSVAGNPAVTAVTWFKTFLGTESSLTIDNSKFQGGSLSNPSLIIYALRESDTATYKCRATNSIGFTDSSQISLTITTIANIPGVTIGQSSYNINSGTTVTLQCTVSSQLTVNAISWTRIANGATTTITIDNSKYTNGNTGNPSLTISSTTNADDGIYVCSASNSAGTASSLATVLTVTTTTTQVPSVTIAQTAFGAQVATTITLGCTVTSTATLLSVYWRRDIGSGYVDITIDGVEFSGSSTTLPSLTIINADVSDTGNYQCFATNAGGTGSSAVASVTISSAVPTVDIPLTSYTTTTGTTYTIPCTATSTTTLTGVSWQRAINGQTTSVTIDNVNFSGATTGNPSLTIITASTTDSGTYTCFASNSAGTASDSTQFTVTGNAPSVDIPLTSYTTTVGNNFNIPCTVSSTTTLTGVSWQRTINGQTTAVIIDNVNFSGASTGSPSLTIITASTSDSGTYTCFASNSAGTTSDSTQLTVTGNVPSVDIPLTSYTTTVGNNFNIPCTVSSTTTLTGVSWQRTINGQTTAVTIDNVNFSGASTGSPSLTIITASTSDSGTYTCFASNSAGTASDSTQLTVTGNVPSVDIPLTSYTTTEGNNFNIPCTVSSTTTLTGVSWQRTINGQTTAVTIDNVNFSGASTGSPSLTIITASTSDSGAYTCFASNSAGTASDSTQLTVSGNVPSVDIPLTSYTTTVGNNFNIPCTVSSTTTLTGVSWQRTINGQTTAVTIDNVNFSGASTGSPSLTIITASTSDSGAYTCFASNSAGTGSDSTQLTVTGTAPSVDIPLTSYTTTEGNNFNIPCTVSSTTTLTGVSWQRTINGQTTAVTIDNVNFSGASTGSPSLTIITASTSDSGAYTCFASNSAGTGSDSTQLTVSGTAPSVDIPLTSYTTTEGNNFNIPCTVSSTTTLTGVSWQRTINGQTTSVTIDNVNFSGVSTGSPSLTIITASISDSGTYTCFASNTAGTGTDSTQLTVSGNAPSVDIPLTSYTTTAGTTYTIPCTATSTTTLTGVSWQRTINGQTTSVTIDNVNFSGVSTVNPSLTIITASISDSGTYTCFASNSAGTGSDSTQFSVSGTPPTAVVSQATYTVVAGSTIVLGCTVSGNPSVTSVSWQKIVNGVSQTLDVSISKYSGSTTTLPSLVIFNTASADAGSYACSATNSVGTSQSSATTLTVTGSLPTVTIAQALYTATTGTSVTLTCTVTANPTHTSVSWERNVGSGTQSIVADNINYSGSTVSSPSLTVLNADPSDSGTYTCFATNAVGQGSSQATTLSVSGSVPTVTVAQTVRSVITGTTVTLQCSVTANPTHSNVFWQFTPINGGTTTLTVDNVNYGGSSVNSPSLTVFNANSADQGTYVCFASNQVGTGQSSQVSLSVTGSIPVVTVDNFQVSVLTGQTITLGCTVTATPTHTSVSWRRTINGVTNNVVIDNNKYQGVTVNNPDLTITNAASSDQANYVCTATNTVGTGTSPTGTTLTVTGSLPTVTVAQTVRSVITGTTVTLQCSVTANPTHSNVFWQFTPINGGTTTLTVDNVNYGGSSVNSPSLTVFNANSADQGTYVCFASNQVGIGQSSQVSLSVTGSIPVVTVAQPQYSVITGQTITLGCTVTATPTHTSVSWRRTINGVTNNVVIDNNKYQGATVNNPSLTITNSASTDQATYTCSATNTVGTGTSSVTQLAVTGSLPVVVIAQASYSVITGQSVTLGCTVTATPTHTTVNWQRIDNGVSSSISIDGVKYSGATVNNPSLTISNAGSNDNTVYTCSATNAVGTGTSGQTTLTVSGSLPVVVIAQASYSVITGQSVTLGCTVTATPTHTTVNWQRIDNGVSSSISIDGVKYSGATVNNPSLTISNAGSNDNTVYTCSATNAVGTGTSGQTTLTVSGSLPVVVIAQASYSVITGQSVTLGCTVTATPTHTTVNWQRIDNGVSSSISIDGVKYSGATVNNPSLTITNVGSNDNTVYTCSATNAVGTGTSGQTTLTVSGSLPVVVIAQASYSVITGQSVTLGCTVTATPTHTTVNWQRIDNGVSSSISIDGVKYSGATVNNPSLTISNAGSNDNTVYTCSATNAVGTGTSGQTTLTVSGSLPVVVIAQASYSVITGQSVTLGCTVTATPTHTTVNWQRIDNGVSSSISIDGVKYSGATVNNPSLTISNAGSNDNTVYTCSATNAVGTGTSGQTTLTVSGSLPVVVIAQASYSVITGQSVTLGCTVTATPTHTTVNWQRIDNGVSSSISIDGVKYSGATVNNPSLTISNAGSNDNTVYTCSATNAVGTGTSGQTTLTVSGSLPVVVIAQASYSVITGQSVTLGCTVSATPTHTTVNWQRIDNGVSSSISIDGVKYSGATVNNPSLTITNVGSNDNTVYTCSATNAVGTGTSGQTTLTVSGSLPVVVIAQASYSVITGQSVTLGCTVTATPTHTTVNWQRIDNGVSSSISIDGVKYSGATVNNPSLTISNAGSNDNTVYTCSATNAVGTGTSGQTTLTVSGSLPVVVIAQASYSVITGQSVTLGCTVSATPTHTTVNWQRIDNGVSSSISIDGVKYSGATVNNPSLTISNAGSNDNTVYTCSATNAVGTGTSGQTTLTVSGSLPVVVIAQASYSVITGQSVTLGCTVSATPTHTTVNWQRIDNGVSSSISIDGVKYSGATVNNPSLTISNAGSNDNTVYTCSATNAVGTGTSGQTTLTVSGSLPVVVIAQASYSVITGQSVTLGCTVTATPTHTTVNWQRIDNGVSSSISIDGVKYSGATVNNPSLTISNAGSNDNTVYTCSATNAVGTGTSGQTTLTVSGSLPVVVIAQASYSVITGQSVTLGCTVTATPTHTTVNWQRIDNGVSSSISIDGVKYSGATVNNPSLTISNAGSNDNTVYTCSATNAVGTGTSGQTTLTVSGNVPVVTVAQPQYSVITGQTITLGCTVTATPTHTSVLWQRTINGVTNNVVIDNNKYQGVTVNNPSLTITNAASTDQATYTCSATNIVGTGTSTTTQLAVTGSLPEVTVPQSSYSVVTGQSVTLDCNVVADPTHTQVSWQQVVNGVTSPLTIDGVKYTGSTVNVPSLTITNNDAGDEGTYICSATNLVGTGSDQTALTITGSLPVVAIVEPLYTAFTGQSVTLECTVSADPAHTSVIWRRIDSGIETTLNIDGVKYSGSTVNNPSLTINNANNADDSLYTCYATNVVGTGSSSQTTLTVTGSLPVVVVSQNVLSVVTGQTVTIGCTVTANPAHTSVQWSVETNGVANSITIDGSKYQGGTVNSPSLTITNAAASDQGLYLCSATNAVGTGVSLIADLTVTGNIPLVTVAQPSYSVITGQTAVLVCTVSADPTHSQVFWQRTQNGVTTTININGVKYQGSATNIPSLTITSAAESDEGSYTCSATNAVGTGTSTSTTLTVTGSIPTVTVAQPSYSVVTGTTVTLQCTVTASPAHTSVFWQKITNGVTTNIVIDGSNYDGSTVNSPSLVVYNPNTADEGAYTCFATNIVGTGQSSQTTLDVTGNLPVVVIAQNAYSVITGQSITLGCTVTATPAHTVVYWQRIDNGVASQLSIDGTKYSGSTVNGPSLTINNAAANDQTVYTCSATNAVGTGTSGQTTLTITGNVPMVTVSKSAYSVVTGQTVSLECTVIADPEYTQVVWQRVESNQTIDIDGSKYSGAQVGLPSLNITDAQAEDQGIYRCSATNIVGTGTSEQTTVSVTGNVPVVNILQNQYSVVTGTTATLDCTVSADPAHTAVYWQVTKNGVTDNILIDGVNYGGSTVSSPSLIVFNTNTADQGVYICFATNIVGTGQSASTVLSVTGSLPVVVIAQNAYSVTTGQSITLGCTVTATPAHTVVYWQRIDNGVASQLSIDGTKYSGSTVNGPSLTINNAAANDQTLYTCSATNAVGTGTSGQTTLTVTGAPPTPVITQNSYSVITGQTITLECTVTSTPAHTSVFWQRFVNGQAQSITIDNSKYLGASTNSPSLTISNAVAADQGSYICFATNIVGTGQSSQTVLSVTGNLPVVVIAQASYSVVTGQSITLVCTVSANPTHTQVYWQQVSNGNTVTIDLNNNKYSGSTVNTPSLTISNAQASDAAVYTCFATNVVGTGSSSQTTLTVTGSPPIVTIAQNAYSVVTGQSITLGCVVTATPQHTSVSWQRIVNGQAQTITIDNSKYSGSTVSFPSLTISNAAESDEGQYICFATNLVSTGQSTQTTLTVTGTVPVVTVDQPTYSVITGQSVSLGCTVVSDPAHTNVVWRRLVNGAYTTITIDGNKYVGSTLNNPSLIIFNTGTSDITSYTCSATNAVGTGTSSATSLSVTGAVPTVTILQPSYTITIGTTVTIDCTVASDPTHTTVFWQRVINGQTQAVSIDGTNFGGSSVNSPSLIVFNANQADEGNYICFATNTVGTGQSASTALVVTGSIPLVTVQQTQYTIVTGNDVTIQCTVTADPAHSNVFWERTIGGNTNQIVIDNVKFSGSQLNSPSLTIFSATSADSGVYICKASNVVGTGQSSNVQLSVTGNVPSVVIAQPTYSVVTGSPVTLVCTVTASPSHTAVQWFRVINGVNQAVSIGTSGKYAGSSVSVPSLTINGAQSSDQGQYLCTASNIVGTGQSSLTSLSVTGNLPVVTVGQATYTVTTGGTRTLVCTVNANPAATTVSWRRLVGGASTPVVIENNKYTGGDIGTPSLTISNAQSSDEGFYICQATNVVGTGESTNTYLDVTGTIPVVTISQNAYNVLVGATATIDCVVSASPVHTSVTWNRITTTNGITVSTPITIDNVNYSGGSVASPNLNVINANANDQGFYVCTATNVVGTGTSNQAFLSVTGAPPTVTVAQTSYSILTGVTVTLQCSAFGNPAVTSIGWTRSINNGPFTSVNIDGTSFSGATVNNPSLVVINADSNDLGIYKCSATNSLGTSESSQVTLTVTGDPPVVTVGQTSYNVITGSDVTLQCSVTATPAAGVVYWEKTVNGVTTRLTIDQTSYSGSTTGSPSLIVYSTQTDDSGVYVCKADNAVGTGQSQPVTVTVTGAVPVVVIAQPSYSVTTGTTATLTCTVTATPQASTIIWKKTANGVQTTVTINNAKYSGGSVTSPSLVITNANSNDVGFYVCQATNAVGTGTSSQTYLEVTGALPIVQVLQPFYTVTKGQSVTLGCSVSGTPAATSVAWERTSGGVTTSVTIDSNSYLGSTINSPSLVISVADSVDTGTYVCTATNSVGTGRSTSTTLSVTGDIPTVAITDPSYTVVTGFPITIPCTVTADPPASSVSWTRRANINDAPTSITIDGTSYSGGSTSVPSLTIVSATAADQGYYICSAANSIGTGTSGQSYLTITGDAPTVTIPSNAYSVITGSSIQIPCTVQASPPASSVTWSKITTASGGNTVTTIVSIDGAKYQGSSTSTPSLTINNANNADQAYYVCAAVNSVGSANSIQTFLTVAGSIPQVTLAPQFTTVLGSSITLDCAVVASPQADSISWERIIGGVTTTLTIDGTKFVGSAVNNPSLTINNVAADDQGFYICIAINSVGIGRSSQGYLTITGNVPAVVINQPSYTIVLGETVTIDCDYSATPDATSIYWNKIVNTQTTRIVITQTNKYSGATLTNPSLTITGTDSSDQAFYRCVVGNSVGEGQSTQAYLYVTGNLPTVTVPQSSYSVSLEDTVTISCTVTSVPSATSVMWEYTNSNGVTSTVDLTNSRFTGGTVASPSLQISSAQLTDQGSYKCKATNSVGQGESADVYLYVTGTLPSVRVTVSAYTVDVGSQATLACIVEASPPATSVYWTKIVDGVTSTISTTVNKYEGSTVGTPSLIINNLAVSDEGSYRCNAINTVGTGQSGLTSLIVAYAPRNTVVNPSAVTRRETESVSSECITDANPAASYQWIKDSTSQIVSNEKILQINNIDRGHDGTYTCTATNTQGSDTARLTVDVQYKPISTVTVAEATVTLSINAQKNLECNTVANPAVQTYRWLKDGNPISNAESLVYQVSIADSNSYGIYTCYATNSIGQSSAIAFTVQSGDVVTTTPAPTDVGLTTGVIIAIVIAAVVFLLIVIIAVCCCVTHGVCRTDDAYESKRIIVEKPALLREPSFVMPRQEVIALQEDSFYRNPESRYRYLPALDYTYYESEGSKRERDRRSYTASIH